MATPFANYLTRQTVSQQPVVEQAPWSFNNEAGQSYDDMDRARNESLSSMFYDPSKSVTMQNDQGQSLGFYRNAAGQIVAPDGYTRYTTPEINSGFDNKYDFMNSLSQLGGFYDPTTPTWDKSPRDYFLPSDKKPAQLIDNDPLDRMGFEDAFLMAGLAAVGGLGAGLWGTGAAGAGVGAEAGLGALNAFDTGAMASSLGYSTPGMAATGAGTLSSLTGGSGGNGMGWLSDLGNGISNFFGGGSTELPIGDIGNALSEQVANGAMTSQEAMSILQNYNNMASGGQWSQFLGDSALSGVGDAAGSSGGIMDWLKKGNSLSSLTGGSGGGGTNLDLMGKLLGTGLGMYGANQQANSTRDLANQFAEYGAPYRQKLSNLYTNPDSFLGSQEVQKPVQMGSDIMARSLSTQGNPTGSGRAMQQLQNYSADQLFGRLGQEKDRLAGFGGLASYNAAAPTVASNAAGMENNWMNVAGAGIADIFNPPKQYGSLADLFKTR
jgi:hypothetical protein